MAVPDRLEKLLNQSKVTGIDFVYVHQTQTLLDVYFHRDPASLDDPLSNNLGDILIYSKSGVAEDIVGNSLGLVNVSGQSVLRIQTQLPVTFALYNLKIIDNRIDPYFNDIAFSFK